jgi:ketosteroid isomerase-like protein
MTTAAAPSGAHPNVEVLRMIYADLPRIAEFAADGIVLHRADRTTANPGACRGVEAVRAHERALVELTNHTLVMDIEHITANDHFGAVLGVLRARHPRHIAMPFCGLWRFANGRITEHWENAYDATQLRELFAGPVPPPLPDIGRV